MKNFFRNNLIKSLGLFILFGIVNIILSVGIIIIFGETNEHLNKEDVINASEVEASINGTESQKEQITQRLKDNGSFYFLIGPDGNIKNKKFLPQKLDHNYSRAEIASFSRWYLDDYPVNTKILDNGDILVIGYPKDSLLKYSFTYFRASFFQTLIFFPLLLFLNFLIFIILFYYQQKKVRGEIEPIITGIEKLNDGKALNLETKGPLEEIKEELNRTSKLLEKKEKDRVSWISGVSHDIKTPLSSILASSELIQVDSENLEHVERIKSNVLKIKALVESLNLINKLNYGVSPLETEFINFTELLRNTIVKFINDNNIDPELIELDIEVEAENYTPLIDPFLFERLLNNLLDNWYKHNEKGTKLIISAYWDLNVYILEGQNEINPVKDGDKEVHYGIGLQLVEQICKLHGWDFETEIGGDFVFRLKKRHLVIH